MNQAPPYRTPPNQPADMRPTARGYGQVQPPIQRHGQMPPPASVIPNVGSPNGPTTLDSIASGNAPSMEFITQGRDQNEFARANKHSWLVQFLKVFLPIMGVFFIVALIATYYWAQAGAPVLRVEETTFSSDKIVMKNPELKGFDKENRPYALNATEAIQNPKKPSVVVLKQIDANVPMQEGLYAKIVSGDGVYDSGAKTLKLSGVVDVVTDDGMIIKLQDADIDIAAGSMNTNNPVSMRSHQADISADAFEIEKGGTKVIFRNRVKMTIYPDKFETSQKQ